MHAKKKMNISLQLLTRDIGNGEMSNTSRNQLLILQRSVRTIHCNNIMLDVLHFQGHFNTREFSGVGSVSVIR